MLRTKNERGAVDWTGVREELEGAAVEWVIEETALGRDVESISTKEEI